MLHYELCALCFSTRKQSVPVTVKITLQNEETHEVIEFDKYLKKISKAVKPNLIFFLTKKKLYIYSGSSNVYARYDDSLG